MRTILLLALATFALAPGRSADTKSLNALTNHVIAIYTLRDSIDTLTNGVPLSALHANTPPALADRDFLSYNPTNHTFRLATTAATRLTRVNNSDTAFILVAQGELVFVGVLSSFVSSQRYSFPTVYVETLSDRRSYITESIAPLALKLPPGADRHDAKLNQRILGALKDLQTRSKIE